MPELPEVETVRRGLEPEMAGRIIKHTDVRRPDLRWPFPDRMAARLTGQEVLRLRRRSKYILMDLSGGETLLIHLGMSGRMTISPAKDRGHDAPQKHDHVVFDMSTGVRISFNDTRRFGMMDLCDTDLVEKHRLIAGLGPEPLGNAFDQEYLAAKLKASNTPIKSALLDQRLVAGLGNIYVCETLWRARVSPLRKSASLSSKRIALLRSAIRDVLTEAIESGGSSLQDYRQADGELGYFQHSFAVYGREGQPCKTAECGEKIHRIAQAGRSSFYCHKCQR
jgi:formamidopyrimidine-DNA glycosylase